LTKRLKKEKNTGCQALLPRIVSGTYVCGILLLMPRRFVATLTRARKGMARYGYIPLSDSQKQSYASGYGGIYLLFHETHACCKAFLSRTAKAAEQKSE
jgi:hypothetical protein